MGQSVSGPENRPARYPGAASAGQGSPSQEDSRRQPWETVLGDLGSRIASRHDAITVRVAEHVAPPMRRRTVWMNYTPALEQKLSMKALWSDALAERAGGLSSKISAARQSTDFLCEPTTFVWFNQREMDGLQIAEDYAPYDAAPPTIKRWQQEGLGGFAERPIRADRTHQAASTPPTATKHPSPKEVADSARAQAQRLQRPDVTGPSEQTLQSRGMSFSEPPIIEKSIPMPRSEPPTVGRAAAARAGAASQVAGYNATPEQPTSTVEGAPAEFRGPPATSHQERGRGTAGKEARPVPPTPPEPGTAADRSAATPSGTSPSGLVNRQQPAQPGAVPLAPAMSSPTSTGTPPSLSSEKAEKPPVRPRGRPFPYLPLSLPRTVSPAGEETPAQHPREGFSPPPSAVGGPLFGPRLSHEGNAGGETSAPPGPRPMTLQSVSATPAARADGRQTAVQGHREPPSVSPLPGHRTKMADLVVHRWSNAILRRQAVAGAGPLPSAIDDALAEVVAGKYRPEEPMTHPPHQTPHLNEAGFGGQMKLTPNLGPASRSPFRQALEGKVWPAPYSGSTLVPRAAGFHDMEAPVTAGRSGSPAIYPSALVDIGPSEKGSDIVFLSTHLPSPVTAADSRLRGYESLQLVLATLGGGSSRDRDGQGVALARADRPSRGSSSRETGQSAAAEGSPEGRSDPEAMAREVYAILKRRLAVERERITCVV